MMCKRNRGFFSKRDRLIFCSARSLDIGYNYSAGMPIAVRAVARRLRSLQAAQPDPRFQSPHRAPRSRQPNDDNPAGTMPDGPCEECIGPDFLTPVTISHESRNT